MPNNILVDPHGSFYFVLEIDGMEIAHFLEFSGLKSTCEIFEIPEGGFNGQVHKFPGISKWENLTLRYCTQSSTALFDWRQKYAADDDFGDRDETSGSIVMKNNAGEEIKRFSFGAMWPVSWEGPALNSGASELAIESLEVAFDRFTMDGDDPGPGEAYEPPVPEPEDGLDVPPVQFEYDSDELTPEGEEVISDVADQLNSEEHADKEEVWVEGHTCTQGSWHYNKSLSEGRARTAMYELRSQAPGKSYYSRGYSWKYPVASNATEAGRIQNRRTAFEFAKPQDRGVDDTQPDEKPA